MRERTATISVGAPEEAAKITAVVNVLSCSHSWASPKLRADAFCFASRSDSSPANSPRTLDSTRFVRRSSFACRARVSTDRIRLRSSLIPDARRLSARMTRIGTMTRLTAPRRMNHPRELTSSSAAVMLTPMTTKAETSGGNRVRGTRSRTSSASATMARSAESEVSSRRSLMPTRSKCSHSRVRSRVSAAKIAEWSFSRLA